MTHSINIDSPQTETILMSHSPSDTFFIGEQIAQQSKPGMIIAVFGNLGSGKTVFIKGACKGLGVKEEVTSPSFTIMNIYSGKYPVFHFDFYRLEKNSNWETLGLEEYFYDDGITLIEWPDRISERLPEDAVDVFIQRMYPVNPQTENKRKIVIHDLDVDYARLSKFME